MFLSAVFGDNQGVNRKGVASSSESLNLDLSDNGSVPSDRIIDFVLGKLKSPPERTSFLEPELPETKPLVEEGPVQIKVAITTRRELPSQEGNRAALLESTKGVLSRFVKNPEELAGFLNPDSLASNARDVSERSAFDARSFLSRKKQNAREMLRTFQQGLPFKTPEKAYQALLFVIRMDIFLKAAPYVIENQDDTIFTDEETDLILGFAKTFSRMDLTAFQKMFSLQPFLGLDDENLEEVLNVIKGREYNFRLHYSNLSETDKVVLGLLFLQLMNLSESSEMTDLQKTFFNEFQDYCIDQLEWIFSLSMFRLEEGMKNNLKDKFYSIFPQKLNVEPLNQSGFTYKVHNLLQMKRLRNIGFIK